MFVGSNSHKLSQMFVGQLLSGGKKMNSFNEQESLKLRTAELKLHGVISTFLSLQSGFWLFETGL